MATVEYSELEMALDFVSSGEDFSAVAYVSRETGQIHWSSTEIADEEELPEDVEDPARYAEVPAKRELDLGKSLVMDFTSRKAPELYEEVRAMFHRRGAYRRYKDLLDDHGRLEEWREYERAATRAALCEWAQEEGFEVVDSRSDVQR